MIALENGLSPRLIADQVGDWTHVYSAPASAYFQGIADAYKPLISDADERLHFIGRRGQQWAQARADEAKKQEFLESI